MSAEQEKLSREEVRLLYQRVKLIDSYIDTLGNTGTKKALNNGPSSSATNNHLSHLPSLRDALSLDIPIDLKQRLANKTTTQQVAALLVNRSSNNSLQFGFTLAQNGLLQQQQQQLVDG